MHRRIPHCFELSDLFLLVKTFADSELDDLLIELGAYTASSTSALMKGKSYNQVIRAHKLLLEVFFRLTWNAFLSWYESQEKRIADELVLCKIVDRVRMVENNKENARHECEKDRSRSDGTDVSIWGL